MTSLYILRYLCSVTSIIIDASFFTHPSRSIPYDAVDRPPPPAIVDVATMKAERVKLYRRVPPMGQPIPVGVQPFVVDDSIPEDKEIAWAVRRLRLNRSDSQLGMRAEHLRQWLYEAMRYSTPDTTNCQKVVAIVHAAFRNGILAKEST